MADKQIKNTIINFGPQHPAAHGVLRMILEMDGETIQRADPHIGHLHRGTEKLMENKTYTQGTPYLDRLDYVGPLSCEHSWILAIEKLLKCEIPERASYIRVILAEITRIGKHLFTVGATAMDSGAVTAFVWAMEERDKILDIFEAVSGARFHMNYFRVGGVAMDITDSHIDMIEKFLNNLPLALKDIEGILTNNRIFKQRMVDIAVVKPKQALDLGFSGPNLRACGIAWDLRKSQPYEVYDLLDFDIIVGKAGDNYDRYLVRLLEMYESIKIIRQCISQMTRGPVKIDDYNIMPPQKADIKQSMEALIHHFKFFSEGFNVPKGETYMATESAAGEFGVYLISDGTNKPYKVKFRVTGFSHLQAMKYILPGYQLADLPTMLGSLDVVFGEVDR